MSSSCVFLIDQLDDERVFSVYEAADAERYTRFEAFRPNIALLKELALERHLAQMLPEEQLAERSFKLMLLDYDGTLSGTLQELSVEMMDSLIRYLEHGVEVAIVTMQPIGERGIEDYTLKPLRAHLAQQGKALNLMQNLHLFPSEGAYYYRCDQQGQVDPDRPLYNLGLPAGQREAIYQKLSDCVDGLYSKVYYRGGYVSYHFTSLEDYEAARLRLTPLIASMQPRLCLRRKLCTDPEKIVLHVRIEGLTKAIARNHMLLHVKTELERKLGHRIDRSQILVAGDRMGPELEEGSDTAMFVYGGVNLAVGATACEGAYLRELGRGNSGVQEFLNENQAFLQTAACPSYADLVSLSRDGLEFTLEERPWTDAYALCHTFTDIQDFLRLYTEQRLRHARAELELQSLHTLTEANKGQFFTEKTYYHHERERLVSWSELYSLMKYGDVEAIAYFAQELAQMLPPEDLGQDCAVVVPAGYMGRGGALPSRRLCS